RETNPDGGGMWRKNMRDNGGDIFGVDLNRNFGYMWGYDNIGSSYNPNSETFRGTAPFSEPETQVIRSLCDSSNFVLTLNFHAFGNYYLYPWGYDYDIYTPDHTVFKSIGDSLSVLTGYGSFPGWQFYLTNGDSDDWMYGEQTEKNKIFSFTPEVGSQGDGFWPDPMYIPYFCELHLQPNLLIASLAENPYVLLTPEPPVLTEINSVLTDSFTLSWEHPDVHNPAVSYTLMELKDPVTELFDCESGVSGWTLSGFSLSSAKSHSPAYSFFSGSGDNLFNTLVTSDYISVQAEDTLTFWCDYTIESGWDYLYVAVSLDGVTYQNIPGNITTEENPNDKNYGYGITGSSGGWIQGIFDLSQFYGKDILLAFYYVTDETNAEAGFYLDDIYPITRFQKSTLLSGDITGENYPVKRKCSGSYYYKVKAKDAQDQESQWSRRSRVDVDLDFTRGDTNSDGKVSLSDIVYLINNLFKQGPDPDPSYSGDTNYDGDVSLADIVYLINNLFRGGPAPCMD
ncbi:MAG: M14 family zinc carboxypeptidase, partial [candidate division Zixibacteria bacterium]|nr:M14 family zinc carboxypeptidase [candidate division Zixibacteria bacterium]